ncbi:MAG: calcium/proton exchanger [Cyanobacteriota bacterium]|nr:calcium/proton exchanger [Cyanobacteriota bacterium]
MSPRLRIALGLLALVPVSLAAELLHWGPLAVCLTAGAAIVPLAIWLSTATEEVALALGPSLGGLLSAVFSNATELIIALVALRAGLVEIVKASITGTVMANLLLVLGLAMTAGGIGRREQTFQPVLARVNGSAMTLAVLAILLPSLSALGGGGALLPIGFSRFVAGVLLLVYGLTLVFSLHTHRELYAVAVADQEPAVTPSLGPWLAVLLAATVGVAVESELFVGVVEEVTAGFGLTPLFTGVVLLPLLGGASEYVTAVSMARKDKMDLAVAIALGSTLLVALLVVPVLVLLGPLLGHPLALDFALVEVVAVIAAVAVSNLVSLDGRSDWLEGVLLLAAYLILAAGFYFQAG